MSQSASLPWPGSSDTETPSAEIMALEARASCLVNPASGLANDYLNVFNEVLLLVENLPVLLPEMVAELLAWSPVTYEEYFKRSRYPGRDRALAAYAALDPRFRREFERSIEVVTVLAIEAIQKVSDSRRACGEIVPEEIEEFCADLAMRLRGALAVAEDLVNHGRVMRQESPRPSLRASA